VDGGFLGIVAAVGSGGIMGADRIMGAGGVGPSDVGMVGPGGVPEQRPQQLPDEDDAEEDRGTPINLAQKCEHGSSSPASDVATDRRSVRAWSRTQTRPD
jgi:hypothetical protein